MPEPPDPENPPLRRRLAGASPRLRARARLLRRKLRSSGASSLRERLDAVDEAYVADGARDITETDLKAVVEQADDIEERFRNHGPLRRLWEDGRLLLGLIRDVRAGRYPQVPKWTLGAAAFALLYVLNPFDLVPDAVPLLGVLDDAAVVSACFTLLEQDLRDYRAWRRAQATPPTSDEPTEDTTPG